MCVRVCVRERMRVSRPYVPVCASDRMCVRMWAHVCVRACVCVLAYVRMCVRVFCICIGAYMYDLP